MKAFNLFVFICLGAGVPVARAQAAPPAAPAPQMPNLPDETVIAIFDDGTKFTMGDFKKYYRVLPEANQQMALRDRAGFLHQWALFRKLAKQADELKMGEQSPYKETLEYARMQVLIQARLSAELNSGAVDSADVLKYYDANKEKYKQVKVKAIYITFSDAAPSSSSSKDNKVKKTLTEEEAKARVTKLLADIRAGADFVKLVQENSEDVTSKAKDGDFATLHPGDNIPDAFRAAVFALKQGEVSEPLRQPNGYYLLRAEEVLYRPLAEVRDGIFEALKQERYSRWMAQVNRETKVEITSPAFVSAAPAGGK
jgi:peptidyl-prolyl cis-trans isomerase C